MISSRIKKFHLYPILIISIGILVFVGAFIAYIKGAESLSVFFLLSFFFCLFCLVPIFTRASNNNLDYFEAPIFISIRLVFVYFVFGLGLFFHPELLITGISFKWLNQALLLVFLGLMGLWLGYKFGNIFKYNSSAPKFKSVKSAQLFETSDLFIIALFLTGNIVQFWLLKAGLYSYAGEWQGLEKISFLQPVRIIASFSTYAIVLLAIKEFFKPNSKRRNAFLYLLVGVQVFWGLLSGMKGHIIAPLILITVVYFYSKKLLPWKIILTALLIIPLIIPIHDVYRETLHRRKITRDVRTLLVDLNKASKTALKKKEISSIFNETYKFFIMRYSFLESIAIVIRDRPYIGSLGSRNLYYQLPLLIFIPRAIWPNKPTLSLGKEFAIKYLGFPSDTRTSEAITTIGDLYINFGILGVFFGAFILGLIYRFFYSWFMHKFSKPAIFVYSILFMSIIYPGFEATLPMTLTVLFKRFIILLILASIAYKVKPSSLLKRHVETQHCFEKNESTNFSN